MRKQIVFIFTILFAATLLLLSCAKKHAEPQTLKEAFAGKFHIGAAMNLDQIYGRDTAGVRVIRQQFDAVVAENCMKSMFLQPEQGHFFFDEADRFVDFGEKNNLWITGHCLVWHNQMPAWLFVDKNGNDVPRDTLISRMKNHITTVVSRYKGRIKGWDVVNEAFNDDGSYRKSKWYEIIGEDFIPLAFKFANEADPESELYYNDFGLANEAKRNATVNLINKLKKQGLRIDAIGMQGHCGMTYPDFNQAEKSLVAFAAAGCKVMITELDLTVLPHPNQNQGAEITDSFAYRQSLNPYADELPAAVDSAWTARYVEMFKIFLKHKDIVTRVTLWGVNDGQTWRNDWPIVGRTDYPLFFDRNYKPKPVVKQIIEQANNTR
ncbi:MAG: endo-1,4-beta-xylanase [Paludibacter sp.]|nr:endo-1,4-beta-xylanase [Paludibacter sp.]